MSNDTMPCGCEGHADNAGLCRYPALERELSVMRARLLFARKRAEFADADNAELLSAVMDWLNQMEVDRECSCQPGDMCPWHRVQALVKKTHPGAARLERMRTLERSVAVPLAAIPEERLQALRDACRQQHKPGAGGAAVCACGMGGGGTLACSALRSIQEARLHAQDLCADALRGLS